MKTQASSKMVVCKICGQYYRARGIKSHLRLKHLLKVENISKVIDKKSFETDIIEPQLSIQENLVAEMQILELQDKEETIDLSSLYDVCYKYYQSHPEIAVKEWQRLVAVRFNSGNISEIQSKKFAALNCLSRVMPELLGIEAKIIKLCMIEAEKYRQIH